MFLFQNYHNRLRVRDVLFWCHQELVPGNGFQMAVVGWLDTAKEAFEIG